LALISEDRDTWENTDTVTQKSVQMFGEIRKRGSQPYK
jgi:hypothetical protein